MTTGSVILLLVLSLSTGSVPLMSEYRTLGDCMAAGEEIRALLKEGAEFECVPSREPYRGIGG